MSVIDDAGRELGAQTFRNDRRGHQRLLNWAQAFGGERRFGIEGSGSYGAGLARLLTAANEALAGDLKLLVDARDQRVYERTRAANRLHAYLVIMEPGAAATNGSSSSSTSIVATASETSHTR